MKIVWFKFAKIYGEKFKDIEKETVEVNSDFNLEDFLKNDILSKKSPVFEFNFTYTIDFEDYAKIQFKGSIFIEINDKKIIKELEDKNINNDLKKFILDYVLVKTHVDSLKLEEQLGIPFHIMAPQVAISSKQ